MWKEMEESFKSKMDTMEKEMNKNKMIYVTKEVLDKVNTKVEELNSKIKEVEKYAKETQEAIEQISIQNKQQNEGIEALATKIYNQNRGIINLQNQNNDKFTYFMTAQDKIWKLIKKNSMKRSAPTESESDISSIMSTSDKDEKYKKKDKN